MRRVHRIPGLALMASCVPLLLAGCGSGPDLDTDFGPTITLTESNGTRPTTAVDHRDGTVYIAWIRAGEGATDLYLSRIEPGTEVPTDPVRVNHIPGDAAPHDQAPPQVVVGPEGNVYLAWQNNTVRPGHRFPSSDLRFARSTDRGQTFTETIYVNDDAETGPPASHTFHDMAIAHDGTIALSWIDSRKSAAAERKMKAQTVAFTMNHHGDHGGGDIGPEIRMAVSSDGGLSFQPSIVVDSDACPCCRTAIRLDQDGAAYIAWRKILPGEVRDIVVARVEAGTGEANRTEPVRPYRDDWHFEACPHAGPELLVDGEELQVAWYTGQPGRAGIYHAVSTDRGSTFNSPTPVLMGDALPPSLVTIAPAGDGATRIAWEDRRGTERKISTAVLRDGRLAGKPLTLNGSAPALAYAHGTTALAWLEEGAVRVRVGR